MNRTEFRRKHNITPHRLRKWLDKGIVKLTRDKMIDEDLALAGIRAAASPNPNHQRRPPAPDPYGGLLDEPGEGATVGYLDERPDIGDEAFAALGDDPLPVGTYAEARAARERYAAEAARLKFEEQRGQLVRADAVTKALGQQLAQVRTRLLSIPAEAADILAQKKSAAEIQTALRVYITSALKELTSG